MVGESMGHEILMNLNVESELQRVGLLVTVGPHELLSDQLEHFDVAACEHIGDDHRLNLFVHVCFLTYHKTILLNRGVLVKD